MCKEDPNQTRKGSRGDLVSCKWDLGPGFTDVFSNCSVFISLLFQIDLLWTAYPNVCVFMIVFIVSE